MLRKMQFLGQFIGKFLEKICWPQKFFFQMHENSPIRFQTTSTWNSISYSALFTPNNPIWNLKNSDCWKIYTKIIGKKFFDLKNNFFRFTKTLQIDSKPHVGTILFHICPESPKIIRFMLRKIKIFEKFFLHQKFWGRKKKFFSVPEWVSSFSRGNLGLIYFLKKLEPQRKFCKNFPLIY